MKKTFLSNLWLGLGCFALPLHAAAPPKIILSHKFDLEDEALWEKMKNEINTLATATFTKYDIGASDPQNEGCWVDITFSKADFDQTARKTGIDVSNLAHVTAGEMETISNAYLSSKRIPYKVQISHNQDTKLFETKDGQDPLASFTPDGKHLFVTLTPAKDRSFVMGTSLSILGLMWIAYMHHIVPVRSIQDRLPERRKLLGYLDD